jgi:hypothetical protein
MRGRRGEIPSASASRSPASLRTQNGPQRKCRRHGDFKSCAKIHGLSAPDSYIAWTNAHLGFNPRGQANSNALSDFVVADLRQACPEIDAAIRSTALTVAKNPTSGQRSRSDPSTWCSDKAPPRWSASPSKTKPS